MFAPHAHRIEGQPLGLADALEPPVGSTGQDFAFAETVHVGHLGEEPAPPSGPIIVSDASGHTQCMTPLSFPLPAAAGHADLPTRLRVAMSRVRHGIRGSVEELAELWAGTGEVIGEVGAPSPVARALVTARRLRALWSFWQWDRADVARAGVIGLAVFLAAATLGASLL